ncbi:MAG: aminotransferase class IV family protein [Candidatus Omnitrophica bacterium]|nr:aminotransferase class IV family protein [Candidatus Omnitrophota bacterium]
MNVSVYSNGREIQDGRLIEKFSTDEIGIFETLRVYGRKIFRLEEHLNRLMESAKTTEYQNFPGIQKVSREAQLALKVYQLSFPHAFGGNRALDPRLKHSGMTGLFMRPTLFKNKIWIMIYEREIPAGIYEKGIPLKTSSQRRATSHAWPAQVKTSSFHQGVMAGLGASSNEAFEWLMLDSQGFATEVRTGNFFMVKNNRLLTPPVLGILNGVTRSFVIECALQSGIPVEEKQMTRHEIFNADEAFLTNTSWEIVPVSELDARRIGEKIPGRLTQKLQKIFKQKVHEECL